MSHAARNRCYCDPDRNDPYNCPGPYYCGGEARNHEAEVERLREALGRIADGEVDGVGDYSECVQLYARQVLDAVRRSPQDEDHEADVARTALQTILDMPCPFGAAGEPLSRAQRVASEAITALSRCGAMPHLRGGCSLPLGHEGDHCFPAWAGPFPEREDPHFGHVAHSISESCIPQCPLYQQDEE